MDKQPAETKPTLLILAAGMGSRYGSLKQIERFGPCGETIIDYSVYDSLRAGFGKVVFVIRKALEPEFRELFSGKFADKVAVEYVSQEIDQLPEGFTLPEQRVKPWGTGHAVWVAAAKIKEPFAVINGDDFYGYQSYQLVADFLRAVPAPMAPAYCLAGYRLDNTLSAHGYVSRGICEVDETGHLSRVTERTHISTTEKGIVYQEPGGEEAMLSGSETVSMNLMGFTPSIFAYCEQSFKQFLQRQGHHLKAEFYLPEAVNQLVQAGQAQVKVLDTPEKWFGVTYPEDKPVVVEKLNALTQAGVYPENLWKEKSGR